MSKGDLVLAKAVLSHHLHTQDFSSSSSSATSEPSLSSSLSHLTVVTNGPRALDLTKNFCGTAKRDRTVQGCALLPSLFRVQG